MPSKVALFVLLSVIGSSVALLCYQCEGDPDSACAKADKSAMKEIQCAGTIPMCLYEDIRNGDRREVTRGCTQYSNPDICTLLYRLAAQNPIALRVYGCKTCWDSLCNTQTTN